MHGKSVLGVSLTRLAHWAELIALALPGSHSKRTRANRSNQHNPDRDNDYPHGSFHPLAPPFSLNPARFTAAGDYRPTSAAVHPRTMLRCTINEPDSHADDSHTAERDIDPRVRQRSGLIPGSKRCSA